ncbi:hypothetical protein IscW_ISCW009286 [Ixodes scapularis]|uniref:Secreted protein n=1 Tax=Ixodes scapularis TaxID=6945 RepID=B7Q105_IXOSC|nr:hypothetical protein IscW_ISCW009286 [Ixodes scapularis]|eukprot:XP_002408721.1 hypothetical protein IscW_ISCW009286 [Ixodes scapularis]
MGKTLQLVIFLVVVLLAAQHINNAFGLKIESRVKNTIGCGIKVTIKYFFKSTNMDIIRLSQ